MNSINKIPLFNELSSLYTGGICHKDFFLFMNPSNCEVIVYDTCLKQKGCIKTEKYQSITDNKKDCYFILTKVGDRDYLYKATYDFLEFDCIKLNIPNKYKEKINDIYFDEKNYRIYIATSHYIYSITIDGYFIKEEAYTNNSSATSKTVKSLNGCCMIVNVPTKNKFSYNAVGKCLIPYISYNKNNMAILSALNNTECKNEICLGENIKIVSIFVCNNKLFLLVIKCDKYNYLYELDIKCQDCKHDNNPCCEKLGCIPKKHHCADPVACILESIALEQTALSHILNAEGEKIQKAIASNGNLCDLLAINKSVTETIFNTTMLEHVLQEKISKVLDYKPKKVC